MSSELLRRLLRAPQPVLIGAGVSKSVLHFRSSPSDKNLTLDRGEQVIISVAVTVIPTFLLLSLQPFTPKEKQSSIFLLVALLQKHQLWEEQPEKTPRVVSPSL